MKDFSLLRGKPLLILNLNLIKVKKLEYLVYSNFFYYFYPKLYFMKKILFKFLAISILAIGCNKDNKIAQEPNTSDSLESKNTIVEDLGKTNEMGKVIFYKDNEKILIFNLLEHNGKVRLNGKDILLNQISFTENTYTAEGDNISVLAENGDFQDITTECIEGHFPKIMITYNGKVTEITNIRTKECPEYNIID